MTDVLIDTITLDVSTGPTTIRVETGQGLAGPRGNYIFSNTGSPAGQTQYTDGNYYIFSTLLQADDIYIRLDDLNIFQFRIQPGGMAWVQINSVDPIETLTYNANKVLTFGQPLQQIALTGNISLTLSSVYEAATMRLKIASDGSSRTLTFPSDWTFIGTKPTTIGANKTGVLTLTSFGTADTAIIAEWAVLA